MHYYRTVEPHYFKLKSTSLPILYVFTMSSLEFESSAIPKTVIIVAYIMDFKIAFILLFLLPLRSKEAFLALPALKEESMEIILPRYHVDFHYYCCFQWRSRVKSISMETGTYTICRSLVMAPSIFSLLRVKNRRFSYKTTFFSY